MGFIGIYLSGHLPIHQPMDQRDDSLIPVPPTSFTSKDEAIRWVINSNAICHKSGKTKRSDTIQVHFVCTDPSCAFVFRARKGADGAFRVTGWHWHTCSPLSQSKVKQSWITEKAQTMLRENDPVKPADLKKNLRHGMGIDTKDYVARRALAMARQKIELEDASFGKLPGFFALLKERTPGTKAEIVLDEGRFVMAFLCPGQCAAAWQSCPEMIALDAAHGTSSYKGVVMAATAIDGSGQFVPLAFGFAPSEKAASWRFFVSNLADALGIREVGLTIISDRSKGIDSAVSEILPMASHSFCAFHLSQNVAQFGRKAASHIPVIANASTLDQHNAALAALAQTSMKAYEYIKGIPKEQWVRAFFPRPRFGHTTSNVAESINAWLLKERKYPPLKFFLEALLKVNALFAERRAQYQRLSPNNIEERTFASVVKNNEEGRRLETWIVSGLRFQVESHVGGRSRRDVDLEQHTCTCMEFQDLGYPCIHACAAAQTAGVDVLSLCIHERRVGALQRVYEQGVALVDMENVPTEVVLPPIVQRQPGRPKSRRIRRAQEERPSRITF